MYNIYKIVSTIQSADHTKRTLHPPTLSTYTFHITPLISLVHDHDAPDSMHSSTTSSYALISEHTFTINLSLIIQLNSNNNQTRSTCKSIEVAAH